MPTQYIERKVVWIAIIVLAAIVFIGAAIAFAVGFYTHLSGMTPEEAKRHLDIIAQRDYARSQDYFKLNYDGSSELCEGEGKTLPIPKNKRDEDDLISTLKSINGSNRCNMFYLAYKQTDPRYESLDGKSFWPSLTISVEAAQPTLERDCLVFSFLPIKKVESKPCKDVKSTCYYYLYDKKCLLTATTCAEFGVSAEEIDILTAYETIRANDPRAFGMAIVDDKFFPQDLVEAAPSQKTCVALAVRNRFRYSAPDGTKMLYQSKRFEAYDAESNCLAVLMGAEPTITAHSCHDKGCAVCANVR